MKAMVLKSVLVAAGTFLAVGNVGLAAGGKAKWCHVCKKGDEVQNFEGKSCLSPKEKKKFTKDCKTAGGKWSKEEEKTDAPPAEANETPGEGMEE